MRSILKTILNLVFDDWWLAGGLLISILVAYLLINNGLNAQWSGWLLLLMIAGTLILSLYMEYKNKMKKMGL